jgi:hypothetical protein
MAAKVIIATMWRRVIFIVTVSFAFPDWLVCSNERLDGVATSGSLRCGESDEMHGHYEMRRERHDRGIGVAL